MSLSQGRPREGREGEQRSRGPRILLLRAEGALGQIQHTRFRS